MILIVKEDFMQQPYEDNSSVSYVFEIKQRPRLHRITIDGIKKAYIKHVYDLMQEVGISVNPNHLGVIMNHSKVHDVDLHREILTNNKFVDWLKNNYNTIQHDAFATLHLTKYGSI